MKDEVSCVIGAAIGMHQGRRRAIPAGVEFQRWDRRLNQLFKTRIGRSIAAELVGSDRRHL